MNDNSLTVSTIRPDAGEARRTRYERAVSDDADDLAVRLVTAPGLVRAGAAHWDNLRTPLQPLSLDTAYADPHLLRDLGIRGARCAQQLGVDVVVGAETSGLPLAASIALAGGARFAFVRKPGYRGHEVGEPRVRGAAVAGQRVLLVDDGIWRGTAVQQFASELVEANADVVGVFCLVDMRDIADAVTTVASTLRTESISSYLHLLSLAADHGVLDPAVHALRRGRDRQQLDCGRSEMGPPAAGFVASRMGSLAGSAVIRAQWGGWRSTGGRGRSRQYQRRRGDQRAPSSRRGGDGSG